jgi:hypothetical protein
MLEQDAKAQALVRLEEQIGRVIELVASFAFASRGLRV